MVSENAADPFEKAAERAFADIHSPLGKTPHKARVERDGRVIAMGTVVDMTAQRGSAAAPDSAEHLQMLEAEPGAVLFYKPITVRAE
jgi:hypothetical protein